MMRTWVVYGIGLGGLLSALSWFGNLRASVSGRISVFPDIITSIALPVLVFVVLWSFAHRQEGLTRATVRRAGRLIVGVGATLFAVAVTMLGMVSFSQRSASMFLVGFAMGFVSFLLLGWLSAWAASMWLIRDDSRR